MQLPDGFVEMLQTCGCPALAELPQILLSTPPEVSVRLNPLKWRAPAPQGLQPVPWCEGGHYLASRGAFTFDPRFHQGAYYVQDASSMIAAQVARTLAPDTPVRWLDACAAPGGKTTAIASALPPGSVVVANEINPSRARILAENVAKWGDTKVAVVSRDTAAFTPLEAMFDIISADVPCSGEGMMRKDPEAVAQWSTALVRDCASLQRTIVANLWPALRPGGYLVYSTCTFNRLENEDNLAHFIETLGAEPVEIPVDPAWGITGAIDGRAGAMRFIPGHTRGEGLFMAVLRKPDTGAPIPSRREAKPPKAAKTCKAKGPSAKIPAETSTWLKGDYEITLEDDLIIARPRIPAAQALPQWLRPSLPIARVKGRDLIPTQELALSTDLNTDAFPTAEVDRPTALAYLRTEALTLPESAPRGIVLLTHGSLPLGFVKNIGRRANNLYPGYWRIKSQTDSSSLPPLPF